MTTVECNLAMKGTVTYASIVGMHIHSTGINKGGKTGRKRGDLVGVCDMSHMGCDVL